MEGDTRLWPVGHDVGAFHTGDGETPPVRQVRLGADLVDLDEPRFAAWTEAHGAVAEDGAVPPVTEEGLRAAHGDEAVDRLLDLRLLARLADVTGFARAHRLLPLAVGLGNDDARPYLFTVGLLNQPMVAMTAPMFDLWQWAHLSPDLWWACREAASVAARAGLTEPDQTEPERVLAGAVEAIPPLLAARVACFDVRIEGPR